MRTTQADKAQIVAVETKNMSVAKHNRELEQEFSRLAAAWKRETSHLSRIDQICANSSYLQIIGMGADAVPLIFQELKKKLGLLVRCPFGHHSNDPRSRLSGNDATANG
jgi:hypothetical protein